MSNEYQKESTKTCVECEKTNSKYKCPKCLLNYCSVGCYKLHKDKCTITTQGNDEGVTCQIEQKPLNLDEYEDIILTNESLCKLKENKKIMTMIRNKNLKKIINEIDQVKYKKKTLERRQLDPDFNDFCGEILLTLGFVKDHLFTTNKDK